MEEIFRSDKLLEFWPRSNQSAKDRVNATARFIIYASCIIYLIQRDPRVFALGALVLGVLYYMHSRGLIISGVPEGFTVPGLGFIRPTMDNSMGNVLLTDYVDRPDRPSAAWSTDVADEVNDKWATIHPFDQRLGLEKKLYQYDASSRFYSMPVTTIPSDQTGFAEAMHGKKNAPFCKDGSGPEFCAPDEGFMGRTHFPENVQLRGGNGRNS